jgi:hypothetical protein
MFTSCISMLLKDQQFCLEESLLGFKVQPDSVVMLGTVCTKVVCLYWKVLKR